MSHHLSVVVAPYIKNGEYSDKYQIIFCTEPMKHDIVLNASEHLAYTLNLMSSVRSTAQLQQIIFLCTKIIDN